jgi:hypothetical protein
MLNPVNTNVDRGHEKCCILLQNVDLFVKKIVESSFKCWKVQITRIKYNQSLNNPLNHGSVYPLNYAFDLVYHLTQFVIFVSRCTNGVLSSNFTNV